MSKIELPEIVVVNLILCYKLNPCITMRNFMCQEMCVRLSSEIWVALSEKSYIRLSNEARTRTHVSVKKRVNTFLTARDEV